MMMLAVITIKSAPESVHIQPIASDSGQNIIHFCRQAVTGTAIIYQCAT